MGIKIKPGQGKAAERELWCYCAAYPVNEIGRENGFILFWLPAGREDESACFADMVENQFCGTFDVVAYLMEDMRK